MNMASRLGILAKISEQFLSSKSYTLGGTVQIRNFQTTKYVRFNEKRIFYQNQTLTRNLVQKRVRKVQVQLEKNKEENDKKAYELNEENEKRSNSSEKKITILSPQELKEFLSEFPEILNDLDNLAGYEGMKETQKWTRNVVEYNVLEGKHLRPALLIKMAKGIQVNQRGRQLINLNRLAWTLNFVNASYCILDDIMDGSRTRRNRPCWYLVDGIGLDAINDGLLLESCYFALLKKYVKGHYPLYEEILDLFQDNGLKTKHGECLDLLIPRQRQYERFTQEVYEQVTAYKTSYYTFYLPIATALLLNNIEDLTLFQTMEKVSLDLGMLFTIQDDFMDCFVDARISGKLGTDIQDGKCSWLAVKALERADCVQRKLFEDNYGSKDFEKVSRIKNLYMDLEIPQLYFKEEKLAYRELVKNIKTLPSFIPKEPLEAMVEFLHQRSANFSLKATL